MAKTWGVVKRPYKRMKYDRQHWTKKEGHYKSKRSFVTEDSAWEELDKRPHLIKKGYTVYRCTICGQYHIGFKNETRLESPSD